MRSRYVIGCVFVDRKKLQKESYKDRKGIFEWGIFYQLSKSVTDISGIVADTF